MRMASKIRVFGMVQGVGFRPFAAELAEDLGIAGEVKNVGGIVEIDAAGSEQAMEEYLRRLSLSCPGARIDRIETEAYIEVPELTEPFIITESAAGQEKLRRLPPDLATCPSCERELFEPSDRRFRHPFISCTACGPRYSILKGVPYDRETVTMDRFPMCVSCAEEYREKGDRRRHAQTICCPDCGPVLTGITGKYLDGLQIGVGETSCREAALAQAVEVIRSGGIVAVKDIGGFHFAFLPEDAPAGRLREFKAREAKPFAVCFPEIEAVRTYCELNETEERLLTGDARPIVLLKKKRSLPEEVLKGSSRIGAMLPCNPLQLLLTRELGPLVMTSGNCRDEPIILHTEEMKQLMAEGCPDFILTHDREILSPLDDSIFQVTELPDGRIVTQVLRRARGIVPEPIILNQELKKQVFACGSDLKAVFGFGQANAAILSPHFGDLSEHRCVLARERERERMQTLFAAEPENSVGDLHPRYISSQGAEERVQHHHAHILSVMAEHALAGAVLGLAFDGTGYGTDGSIWGSEFLLCEGRSFRRLGSLLPVRLTGGDALARDAKLSLTGYLHAAGIDAGSPVTIAALSAGIHTVASTSMGRLFDAAAALLGVCDRNSYEGQCASELELLAECTEESYALTLPVTEEKDRLCGDGAALIASLYRAAEDGADKAALARGFHEAVAGFALETACRIAAEQGVNRIALSGGTFCNRLLLRLLVPALTERGLRVYLNEKVPCGDGGLALGQIYYMMQ